jgi:hypothetical protein
VTVNLNPIRQHRSGFLLFLFGCPGVSCKASVLDHCSVGLCTPKGRGAVAGTVALSASEVLGYRRVAERGEFANRHQKRGELARRPVLVQSRSLAKNVGLARSARLAVVPS